MVEHDLAKVGVASSSLVSRSSFDLVVPFYAGIAQLVEHDLAKVGVASSSLVSRSSFNITPVSVRFTAVLRRVIFDCFLKVIHSTIPHP